MAGNKNQSKLAPILFGPSFMSQVRAVNPKAAKLDLRKTLAFPDERDVPPELAFYHELYYPDLITTGKPIISVDSRWHGKPVGVIGQAQRACARGMN
ncbi:MAG: hypothetical protein ACR2PR_12070 [Pseudohongiellaceae bacterium]